MTPMWTLLVAGAGVLVLQSGFIAALLIQRARRLRAQSALRENQHRYAMATAAGAVGVWDWDFDTNEIYVDPTLKSILGLEDGSRSAPTTGDPASIPTTSRWPRRARRRASTARSTSTKSNTG